MKDNNSSGVESQPAFGVIYLITNTLNGKMYVGQTRRLLEVRLTEHKYNNSKGHSAIDVAIRKYGWENFTVEVLETCSVEMLNEREIFWIAKLNCKHPNGYNLTDGGDGLVSCTQETRDKMSASHKGKSHANYKKRGSLSLATRAKISISHKGQKHTSEARAKMSAAKKGKPLPTKGKKRRPHTPEEIVKISAAQKAYWARKKLETLGDK